MSLEPTLPGRFKGDARRTIRSVKSRGACGAAALRARVGSARPDERVDVIDRDEVGVDWCREGRIVELHRVIHSVLLRRPLPGRTDLDLLPASTRRSGAFSFCEGSAGTKRTLMLSESVLMVPV